METLYSIFAKLFYKSKLFTKKKFIFEKKH